MIWVLTTTLADSLPFSDGSEKNLMNLRPKFEGIVSSLDFAGFDLKRRGQMNEALVIGLLMVATFASLWGMFYARRSYQNTKKIMDKVGH